MRTAKDFSQEPNVIPMSFSQALEIIKRACDGVNNKYYSRMPELVLRRCQDTIFNHLLDTALDMKFKYISLATYGTSTFSCSEILGDNSRIDGWPKVWELTKRMEIGAGCGNSNQSQIHFVYFRPEHQGKWDVVTRQRIGEPDRLVTEADRNK